MRRRRVPAPGKHLPGRPPRPRRSAHQPLKHPPRLRRAHRRRGKATLEKIAGKAADAAAPITAAVDVAAAAVVQPVIKAAAPVKRRAAKASGTVATAARRGTASVRASAASAPKTIRNRASAALDTAKSASYGPRRLGGRRGSCRAGHRSCRQSRPQTGGPGAERACRRLARCAEGGA